MTFRYPRSGHTLAEQRQQSASGFYKVDRLTVCVICATPLGHWIG
ncbi:hypothetical protein CP98_03652 [Sphingobium yanoikuyae]|uniref:Uncharacterized protein n=1 Tax=Sphingobium yanoikuyae TaxID=13690 RepID=A0A084EGR2_SPHYA|nr:hypothetical protein CP98_03652 [Sphingobium yanoikuyae]